jgi:hypothetical protein
VRIGSTQEALEKKSPPLLPFALWGVPEIGGGQGEAVLPPFQVGWFEAFSLISPSAGTNGPHLNRGSREGGVLVA